MSLPTLFASSITFKTVLQEVECASNATCVSHSLSVFYHADIFYRQYINETTQNLYPIPFLQDPLALHEA